MWRGHCWKKTADGPRKIDVRFTEVQLSEHVQGINTYGLCPIAPGESTCRVACLDLDSHRGETPWPEMLRIARVIQAALDADGYKPHLFRSSGGNGIHIYLMWPEPQQASDVRAMLKNVLAVCGYKDGAGGVSKREIEIFGKQNEVAVGSFGSMFTLPFGGATKSEPLGTSTGWCDSPNVPLRERAPLPEREAVNFVAPNLARLKSALDAIPNASDQELSYEEWFKVLCGIHHATRDSGEGLDLAHAFSGRASKHNPDTLNNRIWPYIRSDREGPLITEQTIYYIATRYGWQDLTLADDFDVIAQTPVGAPDNAAPATRFKFVHNDEFAAVGPLNWIVKGVLPDADLAMVFGESGSGKSFWTLDLLLAVARGVEWQGRKIVQGRCAYIAAEGAAGFRNRLKAYKIEHPDESADLHVLGDAPDFLDSKHVRQVIIELKAIAPVKVVVIDTLAQVMPGGDENSGVDMGRLIMHCQMVKKHTGAMPVLIHHSGKDSTKGARGWSGMRGAIDTEIEIERSNHDRVATVTKQKDGADGLEFGFKLRVVPIGQDEDGVALTSCVVDHGASVAVRQKKKVVLGPNEREVVAVWKQLHEARELTDMEPNVPLTSEWVAATDEAMLKHRETVGEANKAAKNARHGVLDKGILVIEGNYVRKVGGD
jgi:hypothetical protein